MKRFAMCIGLLMALFVLYSGVQAQAAGVPQLINYQGYLTDKDGNPLSTAEYKLSFSIYNMPTGGTVVWGPQTFNNVPVVKGYFNVILGPNDASNRPITNAFTSDKAYLSIAVNDGLPITPRQQILSTPYALNGNPAGAIIAYGGTNAPPGYIYCDGSAISRTQYPALFSAIGTNFGNGDGSTTFNLPDLRGRFLRGVDNGTGRDPDRDSRFALNGGNSGDNVGSGQGHQFVSHNHPANARLHPYGNVFSSTPIDVSEAQTGMAGGSMFYDNGRSGISRGVTGVEVTINSVGGNETRPINIYVTFMIKY